MDKIKSNESSSFNMLSKIFIMWGCVDLKDCSGAGDLSNIASTYIGIIIGALTEGFISCLIYNRQEKISKTQNTMLISIKKNTRKTWTFLRKGTKIWRDSWHNIKRYFHIGEENRFIIRKQII